VTVKAITTNSFRYELQIRALRIHSSIQARHVICPWTPWTAPLYCPDGRTVIHLLSGRTDSSGQSVRPSTVHPGLILHDLPFYTVEWPQFHTFIHTMNYMAGGTVWTTHQSVANPIQRKFDIKQSAVKETLRHARSRIHLCTDTWRSPNLRAPEIIRSWRCLSHCLQLHLNFHH
jgi:hypothetical protein